VSLARWQILLILILTITSTAWAGSIYRWVDKDGVVHYSDHAPDNDAVKGDIETRQATAGDPSPGTAAGTIGAPSKSIQTPPDDARHENAIVEIYTTSWCRYCKDTKRYFRSRGISFTEYDVEKDSAGPTPKAFKPSRGRAANGDQWSTDCGIRSGRIRSGAEGILTSWRIPGGISADDTRRWQPIPDGRLIRRAKESRSDDVEKT